MRDRHDGSPRSRACGNPLERTLGRPSPLDCRSEIAQHLWAQKVFQTDDGQTASASPRARARIASRRYVRWAWSVGASLVLVIAGLAGYAQFRRGGTERRRADARSRLLPKHQLRRRAAPAVAAAAPRGTGACALSSPTPGPRSRSTAEARFSPPAPRRSIFSREPSHHARASELSAATSSTLDLQAGESRTVRHVFAREKPL